MSQNKVSGQNCDIKMPHKEAEAFNNSSVYVYVCMYVCMYNLFKVSKITKIAEHFTKYTFTNQNRWHRL